jgi:hypothetical protein
VLISLAVGVALVVAFIAWELRAPAPMLPMRFFASRGGRKIAPKTPKNIANETPFEPRGPVGPCGHRHGARLRAVGKRRAELGARRRPARHRARRTRSASSARSWASPCWRRCSARTPSYASPRAFSDGVVSAAGRGRRAGRRRADRAARAGLRSLRAATGSATDAPEPLRAAAAGAVSPEPVAEPPAAQVAAG